MAIKEAPNVAPEVIETGLREVERRVTAACERAGRSRDEVRLIAVSKTFGAETINAAIEAGATDLGENRVQEFRDKFSGIRREAVWHMIGHLQSNKARDAVRLFNVIHSVDRLQLAERLSKEAVAADRTIDVLVQINIGEEPQKSGAEVAETEELVRQVGALPNLKLVGLMTIPPIADEDTTRGYFSRMRTLRDDARESTGISTLTELSMGMTDDFEIAIEEGATVIRVGRAIFGKRG